MYECVRLILSSSQTRGPGRGVVVPGVASRSLTPYRRRSSVVGLHRHFHSTGEVFNLNINDNLSYDCLESGVRVGLFI